jgi:hypothetical protein
MVLCASIMAELTAILRRRVGVVAVESDEERPERRALN